MVVLPQPDSPTSPNVDPAGIAKDTSATAETCPTFRWSTAPAVTVKFFTRCETESSAPFAPAAAAPPATTPDAASSAAGVAGASGRSGGTDTNGVPGSRASWADPTGKKQRKKC